MIHKVLTVDDSRTIRMIVKKAFQQYNCDIVEAENGMEGLALATKEKPDLIILDITMPVMTGIEMLGKLKEIPELKDIPVIMLTAESGKDNVMNIVKMGVRDYIVKPFKGDQLIERARHIIDLSQRAESGAAEAAGQPQQWFKADGDFLLLTLPAKVNRAKCAQIDSATKEKVAQMNSAWANKLIIDISSVADVNMNVIQLLISLFNHCTRTKIPTCVVAGDAQTAALKGFRETDVIPIEPTIQQAQAAL
jgi:DNA-binding response OmpR family regulator